MSQKNKIILLIIFTLIFLTISLFVVFQNQNLLNLDKNIQTYTENLHSPFLDSIMLSATKLGNTYEALLIYLVFAILLVVKKKKNSFYIFTIATSLGISLSSLLKIVFERVRPLGGLIEESTFSFPSNHATISIIFILSALFLLVPVMKNNFPKLAFSIITVILFSLVALSRIYLSVHWTSDVIAGLILGTICFLVSSVRVQ